MPETLLDGAGVDPEAHVGAGLLALLYHRTEPVVTADVAWVDAHAGRPRVGGAQGHPVVEVDVGDKGNGRAPHDLLEAVEGLGAVDGDAHQIGARRVQVVDLLDRRLDVVGHGVGHRLHGYLRSAADGDVADPYLPARDRTLPYRCFRHLPPGTILLRDKRLSREDFTKVGVHCEHEQHQHERYAERRDPAHGLLAYGPSEHLLRRYEE